MSESNYRPSGELQGDTKSMPNRGTKTGMNGDTYGCDLSVDATNAMGSIKSTSKSDHADCDMPKKP